MGGWVAWTWLKDKLSACQFDCHTLSGKLKKTDNEVGEEEEEAEAVELECAAPESDDKHQDEEDSNSE